MQDDFVAVGEEFGRVLYHLFAPAISDIKGKAMGTHD